MVEPRPAVATVGEVDDYCHHYKDLFSDVRKLESFKFLVLGTISEIKRKSLPRPSGKSFIIQKKSD